LSGKDGEIEAMRNMIKQYNGCVVACVSDSYDIFKACSDKWGDNLKKEIRDAYTRNINQVTGVSSFKLVVRPDSGVPAMICLTILNLLWDAYHESGNVLGTDTDQRNMRIQTMSNPENAGIHSSYRVDSHNGNRRLKLLPKCIGVIQGDGVDYETIPEILETIVRGGFAPENLNFGSGGALLQKLNRDTFKMAFKCSAIALNGEIGQHGETQPCNAEPRDDQWKPVFKNPITDSGKISKKGLLKVENIDGTYITHKSFNDDDTLNRDFGNKPDILVRAFLDGTIEHDYVSDMFDTIKQRVRHATNQHLVTVSLNESAHADVDKYIKEAEDHVRMTYESCTDEERKAALRNQDAHARHVESIVGGTTTTQSIMESETPADNTSVSATTTNVSSPGGKRRHLANRTNAGHEGGKQPKHYRWNNIPGVGWSGPGGRRGS
jgi:nicotinic acid phosphoribosyltransferase